MNILVISHMYPKEYDKNHGIFVYHQVKALSELGHRVIVISPVPYVPFLMDKASSKWRRYKNQPYKSVIDGITVYYPGVLNLPSGILFHKSGLFYYRGVKKLVDTIYKEFKFDIIHCHAALPDGQCGVYLKRHYKQPVVVTVHGQDMNVTIHKSKADRLAVANTLNSCDKVICVSGRLKAEATGLMNDGGQGIRVVHNGFDSKNVFVGESNLKAAMDSELIMLAVGKLTKTKGFDILIKAAEPILKRLNTARLVIIGDGPERFGLDNIVHNLGLEEKVIFTGHLPNQRVMEYMSQSDIFALPSWKEGFGLVYLEAMAHGKPVIGVIGQGIEDIIIDGTNGLLVNPQDVSSLRDALERLVQNPGLREEIGAKGMSTVNEGLNWNANAAEMLCIYGDVIDGKSAKN